jgi:NAD(P)-dependent dehydrogenase (short-subunit alcohol dehydrogenase family)
VLDGKLGGDVAFVTGAVQGIGSRYAIELADAGADICVCDVSDAAETERPVVEKGARLIGAKAEVTDRASLDQLMKKIEDRFGRLDFLVNNAALFAALKRSHFADVTSEEWGSVMAVNVRGCFETIRPAWPLVAESGGGKIVHVSSATAFKGTPNLLHYVSFKAAIVGLTRALAPDNFLIYTIAPGLVMSPPIKTLGDWSKIPDGITVTRAIKGESEPDGMVGTILFLAGPASNFIAGQTIVADGGVVMH